MEEAGATVRPHRTRFRQEMFTSTSLETAVFVDRCPEVSARQRSPFVRRSAAVAARGVGFSFWLISTHGYAQRPEKRIKGPRKIGRASGCDRWLREDSSQAAVNEDQGSEPSKRGSKDLIARSSRVGIRNRTDEQ